MPSISSFAAPVPFARKVDGSLRMSIDYRGLNRISRGTQYPLPRIETILDTFSSASWTCLVFSKAHHQVRIREHDVYKPLSLLSQGSLR